MCPVADRILMVLSLNVIAKRVFNLSYENANTDAMTPTQQLPSFANGLTEKKKDLEKAK